MGRGSRRVSGSNRLLATAVLALLAFGVEAQTTEGKYPAKSMRLIVSSTAGSANDVLVRLASPKVTERLGQGFVIDNRGGANGVPALNAIVQSAPDGYTLLSAGNLLVINGVLKRVPYDIRTALDPVSQLSTQPYLLLVHPAVAAATLKDLIAHAQAKLGALAYGSSGLGSVNHLGSALLASRSGAALLHVPYKSNALALPDLLAGRIQLLFASGVSAVPHLTSGKVKALAISGAVRSPAFPEIPTVAESGLPGYELTNAYFIYVPQTTPLRIRELLNREFGEAMHAPDVRAKLAPSGMDPGARLSLDALKTLYQREYATWDAFIKSSGLKLSE